jgi:hypothetical protein
VKGEMKMFRRRIRPELSAQDIKVEAETDLMSVKSLMYAMLAFYITWQAIISVLIVVFLLIALVIILLFLWFFTGHDQELVKLILQYEFPKLFGPYK